MNAAWIIRSLREIKRDFRHVLDASASDIIDDAIAEIESTKKSFDELQGKTHHPGLAPLPWGYHIYPQNPLRFRPSSAIKGFQAQVDLYCTAHWIEEGALPVEQCIHLRVWTGEIDQAYRKEWDSRTVYEALTMGRVMLRCHFDLANSDQPGPKYHVQFGGNAQYDELCWFPEILNLPRFACPPMDLVLVCQLVAANFFWDEYVGIRTSPEWITTLQRSQRYLLEEYYTGCLEALDQDLLVDHLWNTASTEST
jgi:hypothetical protein